LLYQEMIIILQNIQGSEIIWIRFKVDFLHLQVWIPSSW